MRKPIAFFVVISILAVSFLSTWAQDNPVNGPIQVQITGTLGYEDVDDDGQDELLIDDVVVLPPPGFYTLSFEEGVRITAIGNLLPDNTIQAVSVFLAVDEPGATPESEPDLEDDADARDREEDEREREEEQREREEEQREAEREREAEQREAERERDEEGREGQREVIEVSGEVTDVTQNYIVVDGVDVSAGGIFQPSQFEVGDRVAVTGVYENNGMLRAMTIDVLAEEEGAESDDEPDCIPESHPIVVALADDFAVEAANLVELHCAGYAFVDMTRALLIAEQAGGDAETYLQQYDELLNWAAVVNAAGLAPDVIAPDRIIGVEAQG